VEVEHGFFDFGSQSLLFEKRSFSFSYFLWFNFVVSGFLQFFLAQKFKSMHTPACCCQNFFPDFPKFGFLLLIRLLDLYGLVLFLRLFSIHDGL
jgi:hypothetical protein